ncbi:MAG: Hpt domain-containing protein, partial [Oxalobacteraceae bacterium]
MTIDMSQFFQVFFDETEELLAEKERLLLDVDLANPDKEDLDAIFRTAHSIKGGASTFGFSDMADITHVLESLLDKIRKGEMTLKTEHVDAFLAAKDVLKMQLDGHRNGAEVDLNAVEEVRARLALLSQNIKLNSPCTSTTIIHPNMPCSDNGKKLRKLHIGLPIMSDSDLKSLAAELALLGSLEQKPPYSQPVVLTLVTVEDTEEIISICAFMLDPDQLKISEELVSKNTEASQSADDLGYGFFDSMAELGINTNKNSPHIPSELVSIVLDNISTTTNDGAEEIALEKKSEFKPRETEKNHVNHESSSIRVSTEKVDQLINLVGELVITQA